VSVFIALDFVQRSALSSVVVPYSQLQNLISLKRRESEAGKQQQQTARLHLRLVFFNRYHHYMDIQYTFFTLN